MSDGRGGLATATLTLTVVPINDLPTVAPAPVTTDEDTLRAPRSARPIATATASPGSSSAPRSHGTVTCSTDRYLHLRRPHANYHGADSFEAEVNDGHGGRVRITVPITVTGLNDAPTAGSVPVTLAEDAAPVSLQPLRRRSRRRRRLLQRTPVVARHVGLLGQRRLHLRAERERQRLRGGGLHRQRRHAVDHRCGRRQHRSGQRRADCGTSVARHRPKTLRCRSLSAPTDADAGDTLTYNLTSAPAQGSVFGVAPNLTYSAGAERQRHGLLHVPGHRRRRRHVHGRREHHGQPGRRPSGRQLARPHHARRHRQGDRPYRVRTSKAR